MFGLNDVKGSNYFNDLKDQQKLKVTSVFYTLQGEGPFRGEPAVFIRLTHCNFQCSWCDAFYDEGDVMTFQEIKELIFQRVDEFFSGSIPTWFHDRVGLVVTGGEPMLQDNLAEFLHWIKDDFAWTQIESNGRRLVTGLPEDTVLVVSPKCNDALSKDAVATKYLPLRPEVLERADALKFIMNDEDGSPYQSIPEWAHEWKVNNSDKNIFLSPMNIYNKLPAKAEAIRNAGKNDIDMETRSTVDEVVSFWETGLFDMKANQANHEHAAKYAVQHGFIFQMQLHLFGSLA